MDERKTHPDLIKALVRGELIANEVIPQTVDDLVQWYMDTFKDDPKIMAVLRERESELRQALKESLVADSLENPEVLVRK